MHVLSPVLGVACIQSPKVSSLAAGSMDDDNFASSLESFAAKLAQELLTEHAWAGTVTVFDQPPVRASTITAVKRISQQLALVSQRGHTAGQDSPIGGYRLSKPIPEHQVNLL